MCRDVLPQTTDKKVNECTPALFRLAPDAASMAAADLGAIQACIRSLGLAPTKAKNLKAMSQVGGWRRRRGLCEGRSAAACLRNPRQSC